MANNTRNDSGGSRKSLKGMFQSRSIPAADIKKKITDFSGKTKGIFQSRSEASKEGPKDFVMGERQLDSYGYEKINASEDGTEIFIYKRSDNAIFDVTGLSVCKPMGPEFSAAVGPEPVKIVPTSAPAAGSASKFTIAEILAGTSGPRKVEVKSGVDGQGGRSSEAVGRDAGANIISKMAPHGGDNTPSKVSHIEFMEDEAAIENAVPDGPAEAPVAEAPAEAVPEAVPEPVCVCGSSPETPAEAPAAAEEPEPQAADEASADDYSWIGLEELTGSAGEAPLEAEEVPEAEADAVQEVPEAAGDAPAEIITVVPKVPEKIDATEIEGLQMDGARESDASRSEPGTVIEESLQAAETSGAAVEAPNQFMAALTPDGEGHKVLSDPQVRRPRSRTMRFKNGQLCNNSEPQEELRRPLE